MACWHLRYGRRRDDTIRFDFRVMANTPDTVEESSHFPALRPRVKRHLSSLKMKLGMQLWQSIHVRGHLEKRLC